MVTRISINCQAAMEDSFLLFPTVPRGKAYLSSIRITSGQISMGVACDLLNAGCPLIDAFSTGAAVDAATAAWTSAGTRSIRLPEYSERGEGGGIMLLN